MCIRDSFIAVLTEHCAGKFPLWLHPEPIAILPISDKYQDFAENIKAQLMAENIGVFIDDRAEKIGKKIRDTEVKKVPYMLVVGEKEAESNSVAVRRQGKGDQGVLSVADFIAQVQKEIANYE